jgi:hypothetical protein
MPSAIVPALNACLNATSAVLLTVGYVCIRAKRTLAHILCMVGACAVSLAFLVSYVNYHRQVGMTRFTAEGWIRPVYFTVLISHTILAVVIVPLDIENVPPLPGKKMEECHPDELDLNDGSIAENTRFSYPLNANPNVMPNGQGPHPQTIVLLTADAFGVLPPISILEPKDVMYHFVSGFTARVAGTEVGVTEPQPTFSACFGGPFMAHKPNVYAKLLADKMQNH